MIQQITHAEAVKRIGEPLPNGMNWYKATCLQFFPKYGDWKLTWTENTGISAIIGMKKRPVTEPERELEGAQPF